MLLWSLATLALWWGLALDWALGVRSMRRLGRARPPEPVPWPTLSVVVPARDEAATLPAALASLRAQDLPGLEILLVDDRSGDGTGALCDDAARADPRIRALHVERLPDGWLGKTHALALGAERARGAWLLFTDADVRFAPGALRRALAYAEARNLDHLAALPRFVTRGPFIASFVAAFALLFSVHTRPWRARLPGSGASIGIGAFGLVRRHAYDAIGGHAAIRLRPDDDLALGRRLKHAGFRQEAVFAAGVLEVEWYPSLVAGVRGLEKNAFAGLGFSRRLLVLVVGSLVLTNILPYALVFVAHGPARLTWLAVLATIAAVYAYDAPRGGHSPWLFALHPIGVAALCWAACASAIKALRSGEIEWRGTRYRLDEVRRGADD